MRINRRQAQLSAYILLVVMFLVSIALVRSESAARGREFIQEREQRANSILVSLVNGSVDSCISANTNQALPLRKLLYGSAQQSVTSLTTLEKEGTFSHAQVSRILRDNRKAIKKQLRQIKYRDCNEAGARYALRISSSTLRGQVLASVRRTANSEAHKINSTEHTYRLRMNSTFDAALKG